MLFMAKMAYACLACLDWTLCTTFVPYNTTSVLCYTVGFGTMPFSLNDCLAGNHDYGEYNEQTKHPPSDRCKTATNDGCFWSPLHQVGP